ncbi:hypothetical protein PCE1_004298 [Barthelona sp. PCE]
MELPKPKVFPLGSSYPIVFPKQNVFEEYIQPLDTDYETTEYETESHVDNEESSIKEFAKFTDREVKKFEKSPDAIQNKDVQPKKMSSPFIERISTPKRKRRVKKKNYLPNIVATNSPLHTQPVFSPFAVTKHSIHHAADSRTPDAEVLEARESFFSALSHVSPVREDKKKPSKASKTDIIKQKKKMAELATPRVRIEEKSPSKPKIKEQVERMGTFQEIEDHFNAKWQKKKERLQNITSSVQNRLKKEKKDAADKENEEILKEKNRLRRVLDQRRKKAYKKHDEIIKKRRSINYTTPRTPGVTHNRSLEAEEKRKSIRQFKHRSELYTRELKRLQSFEDREAREMDMYSEEEDDFDILDEHYPATTSSGNVLTSSALKDIWDAPTMGSKLPNSSFIDIEAQSPNLQ